MAVHYMRSHDIGFRRSGGPTSSALDPNSVATASSGARPNHSTISVGRVLQTRDITLTIFVFRSSEKEIPISKLPRDVSSPNND